METPEEIATSLMAPASPSALWTHAQVRALLIEAAQTAPLSTAERRGARGAIRMVRDAVEQLFGPVASLPSEEGVLRRGPEYHHDADAIIAGLQRVHDQLRQIEAKRQ
jgi:hypothetical protein